MGKRVPLTDTDRRTLDSYGLARRGFRFPQPRPACIIVGMENGASRAARILVLYYSNDGHTKMMADLVAEGAVGVPDTEVRIKTVNEATAEVLVWCDGVAVGSPTHMGTIAWEMKRWWDETAQPLWPKIEGKLGCAFTSSGGIAGGGELTCLALQIVLMNYGLLVFGIPDYVAPGQTLHYGAICAGRPRNEGEREACRRLGRRLSEWVQTLICHRPEHDPRTATYARLV
jgi:NAD(P)H dehydrogenase (quinone)